MIFIKQNLLLHFLLLSYTLSLSSALVCKTCQIGDSLCLFEPNMNIIECENDDDVCYKWFSRTGPDLGVQRDCISIKSTAYKLMKRVLADNDRGCVKRMRGFHCFKLCSTDLCN